MTPEVDLRKATRSLATGAMLVFATTSLSATPDCDPGAYGTSDQNIVVLTPKDWIASPGLGYLILDGRYGSTLSATSPITCGSGYVRLRDEGSQDVVLKKRNFTRTRAEIAATGAVLAGELLEPVDADAAQPRPLVVMVHGSETEPAIGNNRAWLLAAQGMRVYTFDKRGTGQSGGLYTQNFEILADDAAAAMAQAQTMTHGRINKSGYWGQSQGGWVAPLAATRSKVDFVVVGFGLINSPIAEDRDQMLMEAQTLDLNDNDKVQLQRLSDATAAIVSSHFTSGLEALEALRKEIGDGKWTRHIKGEYSGDMLRMTDADLRRVGRAVFDNLELIWDYDSSAVLKRLDIPMLWILAEHDREAPIETTLAALASLKAQGKPIDIQTFPRTDHGMYEFVENDDSTRTNTRVTDGYFRLVADWITERAGGNWRQAHGWPGK